MVSTVAAEQLADLSGELAAVTGDPVLASQPLTNWRAALAAVGRFAETGPTLVVLDAGSGTVHESTER